MNGDLSPELRDKLAKVLALLGSPHSGERDAAAIAASGIVKAAGLTWQQIVAPAAPTLSMRGIPPAMMAQAVLFTGCPLATRDMNFLIKMAGTSRRHRTIAPEEMERLTGLYARACAGRGA